MRWKGRRRSGNVEDRRLRGGPRVAIGGGCGALILVLLFLFLGGDPQMLVDLGRQQAAQTNYQEGVSAEDDEKAQFISVVLADTEDVWGRILAEQMGVQYEEPKLVLFSGQVQSACGFASAASGPFYCPGDRNVYIDLAFFRELSQRFGAPGDFAQAYVVAHEVGHHVQNLLGITDRVHSMRGRLSKEEYNQLSVRLELQADFLAGVWAHHAQKMAHILEPGDIEEALRAASAIGDDTLQKQMQGYVVPDAFTHGSSEQRVKWFTRGFMTGDMRQGDTFSVEEL